MRETWIRSLGWEDLLEKGTATHSSILENSVDSPTGSQRVRHNWAISLSLSLWHFFVKNTIILKNTLLSIYWLYLVLETMPWCHVCYRVWSSQSLTWYAPLVLSNSVDIILHKLWEIVEHRGAWDQLSMGSQRVRHDLATEQQHCYYSFFSIENYHHPLY